MVSTVLIGCNGTEPEPTASSEPTATPEPTPETINLKFSSPYMDVEPPSIYGAHMCDLIEEKTNGQVKIERFTGGVLGSMPEHLGLVSSGSVDLVILHSGLYPRELPLTGLAQEGNQLATRQQALENIRAYHATPEVKAIRDEEQRNNNIIVFDYNQAGTTGLMCREPASSLADLAGRKISAWDQAAREAWSEFDTNPVNVQIPETYEALSRGLLDVGFGAMGAHFALKWYEVGKSYLDLRVVMMEIPLAMNLETYESLPANVQEAVLAAARETAEWTNQFDEEGYSRNKAVFEEAGVVVTQIPFDEAWKYQEISEQFNREGTIADVEAAGVRDKAEILWQYWDEIYDNNRLTE